MSIQTPETESLFRTHLVVHLVGGVCALAGAMVMGPRIGKFKKDGTPICVEVSTKILPDGRWQAFVRDIGERKRAQAGGAGAKCYAS